MGCPSSILGSGIVPSSAGPGHEELARRAGVSGRAYRSVWCELRGSCYARLRHRRSQPSMIVPEAGAGIRTLSAWMIASLTSAVERPSRLETAERSMSVSVVSS